MKTTLILLMLLIPCNTMAAYDYNVNLPGTTNEQFKTAVTNCIVEKLKGKNVYYDYRIIESLCYYDVLSGVNNEILEKAL